MLSIITFSRKIIRIKIGTKIGMGLKLELNTKTKAKLEIRVELGLLTNLSTILESTNLDYIYFNKKKPNTMFLKRFFLFDNILLA